MNVQTHLSGQISGQVPDQAGAVYVGLAQQNGNSHHMQKQNIAGQHSSVPDPARRFMQGKIYECLMRRQTQTQSSESARKNIIDIVRRLEDGLFNTASTMDEYRNLETLESRLHVLIQRRSTSMNNPQPSQFVNSSGSFGTMIPTPGIPHHGNSNLMASSMVDASLIASSGCNIMPSSVGSSGTFMQAMNGSSSMTHSGSFHTSDGGNIISTMGDQRVSSQMIPTPGFSSSNNNAFMNAEAVSNGNGFSTAESLLASQRILQKHSITGQNSQMMQGFGNHMGTGMRSNMQQRSYASFQNASVSGGLGSNVQSFAGSGSSESYSTTMATFGESPRPSQRKLEQQPRILMQGDGGGLSTSDSSVLGNFSSVITSSGMVMSNQNMDRGRLHPLPRSNLLMGSQPNLQSTEPASQFRSQSSDQSDKLSLHKSLQSRDHVLQPHQQYHRPSHQFPQQQPFLSHHGLQKQGSMQDHGALINNILQRSSDISAHVKAEPNIDHLNEVFQPQVSGQFQFSELQTQFRQSSGENIPMIDRFSQFPSDTNEMCSTIPLKNSQQVLQPYHSATEGQNQNDFLAPSGVQSLTSMQRHWRPDQEDRSSLPGRLLQEQKVREDFCQRLNGHDEAQCNNLPSSEGSISGQTVAFRNAGGTLGSGGALSKSFNSSRERQFFNQKKWLLILQHARCCKQSEGKCSEYCFAVKKLWKHMDACNASQCIYLRCQDTKKLILHNKQCRSPQCPVCVPVNSRLMAEQKKIRHLCKSSPSMQGSVMGAYGASDATAEEINVREASQPSSIVNAEADSQPSLKRIKTELPLQAGMPETRNVFVSLNSRSESGCPLELQPLELRNIDRNPVQVKPEPLEVKMDACKSSAAVVVGVKKDSVEYSTCSMPGNGQTSHDVKSISKLENVKGEKGAFQVKQEDVLQSSDHGIGTKSGKPNIKGVSLTELFTPEQVRAHIRGLRQWVGQTKAKAEKNQAMERSMSENSCQLCAVEKLTFDPPPIYCTRCNFRIKRNAFYYTVGAGDTCHYICVTCFSGGDTISIDGSAIPKARFEKKKNDDETEEWWVQCDKCEAWQHQICALFNGRRNDGGQAEYTCPNCYIEEVESGERKPLPQSAVLGAKDLPGTILSDHIEQRLFRKLKEERHERALKEGKSYDEVPGADGLVVRVVSSVDKKLEVKPRFLEIFREENYPSEFAYKSKVVLLFQKIEGVEVCLFGMYVQEFGSECPPPNQRRVYLSYLDSVKYFRPEVRAVNGEALRTFVYHQILIGYLEYCKERGFTSCYIWACPPAKGEDYILYCHPEIQKTPKSDKLREWYLSMLKKASEEKIVVELTNFYDHFFVNTGECKAKITASRLPYFEGDYWPGAAEETIEQLVKEEEGRKQNKKGITKKLFTKRTLKACGQLDLSTNASKDLLLMHRLGETILPMKEDFIMVHLQYSCTHCCVLMVSGNRWVCKQCRSFQICHACYEAEQKLEERERHPVGHKEKHTLHRVEIKGLPEDTKDKDDILESEFFDTRQAFLSLCQGNHYQYDTLRRAKHSSMMVLYHLHNPTAPAFVTTCNICHLDIETGQGWRCETCPDYDVCNSCYQREGGIDHPHKLTNHPSLADRDAQNKEARQQRVLQLRKMLDLLVHASQCRSPHCQYPNCRKVKGLFRHGIQCKTRASGGCLLCKKMWYLLQLHARACKESQCHVPRCRDLKDHLRRLQQQSDSRRRAAVMEMMRQRAAEVAGNSS